MRTKLHGLDHLRALAIIMVLLFHYSRLFPHPEWMEEVGRFGWTGVDLFFVLSGYLISAQLFQTIAAGKPISLREFFIKRIFRILPAYLLLVMVYFLFPVLREREALAPLWKYLTFTQNIGLNVATQGTFSHAWSLCIEEQFYLLFPLSLLLLLRLKVFNNSAFVLFVLFVIGLVLRLVSYQNLVQPLAGDDGFGAIWYKWIYYAPWCRADGLLIGVAIAAIAQFKPTLMQVLQRYSYLCLAISLALLGTAWFICLNAETFNASVFGFPLVDFGYGFMVLAALGPRNFLYRFNSAMTVKIAALSYGIYLSHKIVFHVTQMQLVKFNLAQNSNLMMLICFTCSLLLALLINWIVEKPFLRLRNKMLQSI